MSSAIAPGMMGIGTGYAFPGPLPGNLLGWGYQDFSAGSISTTNVTITNNQNGIGFLFNSLKIISSTAVIVRKDDPDSFAYSGATKLFSTRVAVNTHSLDLITLNAVPDVSWGDIRIYFAYTYDRIPNSYALAPKFIRDTHIVEVDELFVSEEEFAVYRGSTDYIQFNTTYTPLTEPAGLMWWDNSTKAVHVSSGLGPVLTVGQETWVRVYNDSGALIPKGTPVYFTEALLIVGGLPTIAPANATTHVKIAGRVLVTEMDIPNNSEGIASADGRVTDVDTTMWNIGDVLWVGTTDGQLTNVRPSFPNYAVQVGIVEVSDAKGVIQLAIKGQSTDTIVNFFNGTFRETVSFTVSSDGATITGTLQPENGHADMTMIFSDGFSMLDTSPPVTIVLTPGSATIPQTNYVYIPQSTKVLTVSTSGWPTMEHIKVSEVVLLTAALTKEDGPLRNQNWNDHIEDTFTFQGHLSHIAEKIRQFDAQWDSGVEGSATITGGGANAYVSTTSGTVYQLHKNSFPLLTMVPYTISAVNQGAKTLTISGAGDLSSIFPVGRWININASTGNNGLYSVASRTYSAPNFIITVNEAIPSAVADGNIADDIHVVNRFTNPYSGINNLTALTLDASGNPLLNTSFSIVVWAVNNKGGSPCHLMCNLPTDTYSKTSPIDAVNDALNYSVYTIPKQFKGVGFLVARFTFVNTSGSWSLYDTEDLRGKVPNSTAGGGGGGAGATSFLGLTDTPSSYTGNALNLVRANAGETALEFFNKGTDWLSQYALLAGRTGGQVFAGGSGASENLELASTVNPTKGYIFTNDYVGIGGAPTVAQLHLRGAVASGKSAITVQSNVTDNNPIVFNPVVNASTTGRSLIFCQATITPTANIGTTYGMLFIPSLGNSSFDCSDVRALFARVDTRADYSGNIGTARAFFISNPTHLGSGTISNNVGLEINNMTMGTVSNTAIKTGLGLVTFGDDVVIANDLNVNVDSLFVNSSNGRVGMNTLSPTGQAHINQDSSTAAIPTLTLAQSDLSEGFIDFIGSERGVITGATNSVQSVRVELNGVVYRLALYADA